MALGECFVMFPPVAFRGAESGLVVEIPEAEAVIGPFRARLDVNAQMGVPAHVTVLHPFVPPDRINEAVLSGLRRVFAGCEQFEFVLDRTAWFGETVVLLAPSDPAPFLALTERVFAAFPAFPPSDGEFEEVVPHVTLGHRQPLAELRRAEARVVAHLPIAGRATRVTLLVQEHADGHWVKRAVFPLGMTP